MAGHDLPKRPVTMGRNTQYPVGRFTLAFVGYGAECADTVLELTCNWDRDAYEQGGAFGHIALAVAELASTCAALAAVGVKVLRVPGEMLFRSADRDTAENIAFIEDPDGYKIELVEMLSLRSREVVR